MVMKKYKENFRYIKRRNKGSERNRNFVRKIRNQTAWDCGPSPAEENGMLTREATKKLIFEGLQDQEKAKSAANGLARQYQSGSICLTT